jgi:hypothetical protein
MEKELQRSAFGSTFPNPPLIDGCWPDTSTRLRPDAQALAQGKQAVGIHESLTQCWAASDPDGIGGVQHLARLSLSQGNQKRASSLLEQASTQARTIRAVRSPGYYLADLGIVTLYQANYEHAQPSSKKPSGSPPTRGQDDDRPMPVGAWRPWRPRATGQAIRASAPPEPGAAINLRMLAIPPFVVRSLEERLLTPLLDTLGDEFRTLWVKGQTLPVAGVIAYGLGRY